MCLGPLEVIAPINRIKPRLEHKLGPLPVAHDKTAHRQTVLILRQNELHIAALEVAERLDDAVGRYDGLVFLHQGFYLGWRHNILLNLEIWVHDERVLLEEPHEVGVWVFGQGVPCRYHARPGCGCFLEVVVLSAGEESLVTCLKLPISSIFSLE